MIDFIYSMQFIWVNYQKHQKKLKHTQHQMDTADTSNYENILILRRLHFSPSRE